MESYGYQLTYKKIFLFWVPLAATWLMMSIEGPFLSAVIARLPDPKYNLAAYGVAFSFALIIEAPIIMMLSASTALVKDRYSFKKLRNFTYTLNGIITGIMILILIPFVFYFITMNLIGLPQPVARLTHYACIILLPWPGAIGYRRFYQGILIRSNLTRWVAYGTVIRLSSMAATALILYFGLELDGALVGAAALSVGVTLEAIASRLMANQSVKRLPESSELIMGKGGELTYGYITRFYYPLALTSIIGLAVHPMITFFIGQSRMAIESLAVFPVINSLVFIFRSMGLSYQEVGIALMGDKNENYEKLRNYAATLGIGASTALAILSFTPLANLWFHNVSGLSLQLTDFSILPTRIMSIMPALTVLLAFQRSVLVNNKKTTPVTIATGTEVLVIISLLLISIELLNPIGIIAAAFAFVIGRLSANSYLFFPYFKILKKARFQDAEIQSSV